jgi:hypothetical protein
MRGFRAIRLLVHSHGDSLRTGRGKPNTRDTSRKVAAPISQNGQETKQRRPNPGSSPEQRPQIGGDFVAPDGKAKSLEADLAVFSHLEGPVSQVWARYFALRSTSVGFGPSKSTRRVPRNAAADRESRPVRFAAKQSLTGPPRRTDANAGGGSGPGSPPPACSRTMSQPGDGPWFVPENSSVFSERPQTSRCRDAFLAWPPSSRLPVEPTASAATPAWARWVEALGAEPRSSDNRRSGSGCEGSQVTLAGHHPISSYQRIWLF